MNPLNFAATIVLVTASGALAPGPLSFAAISHGVKLGARGGLSFAIGHTLFEFPLIILLALGLNNIVHACIACVLFMYICHVWMDYAWLTAVAHFARVGINMIGARWYRAITAFFGVVLIYFGITFIVSVL